MYTFKQCCCIFALLLLSDVMVLGWSCVFGWFRVDIGNDFIQSLPCR